MIRVDHAAKAAALFTCALALPTLAQTYRLTELPTLGSRSVAHDINDAGVIVGTSRGLSSALDRPVIWQNGLIADLDPNHWYGTGAATAIDNDGRIAVGVDQPLSCVPTGVMLIRSTVTSDAIWFPEATAAMPSVITGDESVFGFMGNATTFQMRAAGWTSAWQGCSTPLGTVNSEISGANASGKLVGWRLGDGSFSLMYPVNTLARAVVIDGGQITELPPANWRSMSMANDITDSGIVVGSVFTQNVACVPQVRLNALPIKWVNMDANVLPMPGNSTMGAALGINERGEIFGQVTGDSSQAGPVVWRGNQVFKLLARAQPGHNFVRLETVNAINNAGQIVGSGVVRTPEGTIRFSAFVATPCYANFDGLGGVTTSDLFGYLNAFFTGDARADVGGAAGLTNEDLFGFLNAWFGGC